MKDFNNDAANTKTGIIAVDTIVETSVSKVFAVQIHDVNDLPIAVHRATYQGQNAASIRVAINDAELESYVASAGSAVEILDLPSEPLSRAKFITQWSQKIAKKNKRVILFLFFIYFP